ncbi:hypothetical protein QX776_13800 [Alteromonadaceae bacterium BrNp21-10]|nr:hypothetical protein [Alteromonadaceae bacterium BrNp21-10]
MDNDEFLKEVLQDLEITQEDSVERLFELNSILELSFSAIVSVVRHEKQ